ncbi:MAG: hypothetical protein LC800_14870, partial [Acidobacteria bacterium]|nr:hypothetical protein [Acidobacteriota bacterium]
MNVVIDASFTGEAAAAITRAFGNWNAERDIGGNCSGVLFLIVPSPPDLSENTALREVPPGYVYVVQDPSPPVGTLLNPPSGGVVVGALITLDDCLTNNDSITGVMAHEIGHAFALEDCLNCPVWSSILAAAYEGPNGDWCNANYGGLGGPRECDNRRLSRDYYCLIAEPSPTPTPSS